MTKSTVLHGPENAKDLSEDHALIHNDRIHRVVLGLQPKMSVLFVESLYGSSVLN